MTSKGNGKECVLKYLTTQNRPYSANDIMQNLHNEFGKAVVQKALDDLTSENRIREKVYGKQKVYCVVQEDENDSGETDLEIKILESKIEDVREKVKAAEQELKQMEVALKELESQPTTKNAHEEKSKLEEAIKKLEEKVKTLSNSSTKITSEEKNKVYKDHEKFEREYKKRKRICMDIVNSILENYPKKSKVLFEEIGIETD